MKPPAAFIRKLYCQQGSSLIVVACALFILLALASVALDMGHLYIVKNELQNAADAGALAGARSLYNEEGTAVNEGANQIGYDAATANRSDKIPVDVNWTSGNTGDVERGHWSFATRTFTPNASLLPVDLWNVTTEELDADPNFINAVRVRSRRESTPAYSLLAGIFGHSSFNVAASAVAYIGFAGSVEPFEVDQPIAICKQSLLYTGEYTCSIGRMINSGSNIGTSNTGGWTDFNQEGNPCAGGTNAPAVRNLVCSTGNPVPITLGANMATSGGEIQTAFTSMRNCWTGTTNRTTPWILTLPVVDCPGNNVSTCQRVVGVVTVSILWITGAGEDPSYSDAPRQMGSWSSSDPNGQVRWNSFVQTFNLLNVDGTPAPYQKKAIYFLPDCAPHIPAGRSGGEDFGTLAKIPSLVQ